MRAHSISSPFCPADQRAPSIAKKPSGRRPARRRRDGITARPFRSFSFLTIREMSLTTTLGLVAEIEFYLYCAFKMLIVGTQDRDINSAAGIDAKFTFGVETLINKGFRNSRASGIFRD